MKINKILLPVDFSHSSDGALRVASSLAADSRAELLIVHVGEDSPAYIAGYGGFAYDAGVSEKIAIENHALLEKVKPTVSGVHFEHRYLSGDPANEILALAESEQADLIVIGSHGRTGFSRMLLGSVAETVVRKASCPVLTVKQPTTDNEELPRKREPLKSPQPMDKHSLH